MVENHLKNRDPRPKRRKDKYNPYTIFTIGINTDSPRYYLSFTDSQNIHICMEIEKELFDVLDQFELDDLSVMHEVDNHYENSVLTEESLNARAVASAESLDDLIFRKSQYEKLHKAISKLPDLQRRRLALYYFGGYTFEQIGNMEGCTKRAVKKSVDAAVANLRNILEKNNL